MANHTLPRNLFGAAAQRAARYLLLTATLLALLACDKSGVHDLGRANDTLSTCGDRTSTWLRSLDETTELFVLGTNSPGNGASAGCYVRAVVNQDSSVEMETGSFTVDNLGAGTTEVLATYRFLFQPELSPLQREGARRFDQDPPIAQALQIDEDAGRLTITVDGEARRLTSLPEVIRRLDTTTQGGAEDIFRLVNIMFYMSQTRVQGFGATGMTMYTTPSEFNGIVAGTYRVAVQGGLTIRTDLTYTGLRDLTDIQMDGNQHTAVSLSGNGPTSESLLFTLDHPDQSAPIEYTIFYDDLIVVNGAAGDGMYQVDAEGNMFTLDWSIAQDVHLRNVLPVGE